MKETSITFCSPTLMRYDLDDGYLPWLFLTTSKVKTVAGDILQLRTLCAFSQASSRLHQSCTTGGHQGSQRVYMAKF